MTNESERERVADLFARALEWPPAERDQLLAKACRGNTALHRELISLLAHHDAAPDYLDQLRARALPLASEPRSFDAGDRVGRFVVVEPIARGGMGVVVKARDTTLDRIVALKVLPPHASDDPVARARLVREARAASALDHPNIGVIYELGPAEAEDGVPLHVAMAYYAGDTLANIIARGPLQIEQAIEYAAQLCAGLAHAHASGIVHRDVKPANAILTDRGEIKILDFGISSVLGSLAQTSDAWLGTLAYMSPEQTRGEETDTRSDIWSLGVTLYELITGERPYRGESSTDVVQAIRAHDPVPLAQLRPDAPTALAHLVQRCLAKRASERPASCVALAGELRAMAQAAPTVQRNGILVLPFVHIGSADTDTYFTDGLTEEVIRALAALRALRVISPASAMRLRGNADDRAVLGRQLAVRYIVEGSVRSAANGFRVTARLVDTRDDVPIWTDAFDAALPDLFALQERIARQIAEVLRIQLSPAEMRTLAAHPIRDWRAYESYLRARYEAWRFTREGLDRARRYIDAALAIVGPNELLYSTLGHITVMHFEAGIDPGPAALERVAELADRVAALDPDAPRGHWLRAFVAFQHGDIAQAIRASERAVALAPDDADAMLLRGYILAHVGAMAEARVLVTRALEIDPLTPLTQCMPGFLAVLEGRFDEAVAPYRRVYEMDPESPFAAVTYGWVLGYAGRHAEAVAILAAAADRFAGTAFAAWARSLAYGLGGDAAGAIGAITATFEAAARGSEMFARALAQCLAVAGDTEAALDWLERAVARGLLNEDFLAHHDRYIASLRDTARFQSLLQRVRATTRALPSSRGPA